MMSVLTMSSPPVTCWAEDLLANQLHKFLGYHDVALDDLYYLPIYPHYNLRQGNWYMHLSIGEHKETFSFAAISRFIILTNNRNAFRTWWLFYIHIWATVAELVTVHYQ